jgi:hypothetical protein
MFCNALSLQEAIVWDRGILMKPDYELCHHTDDVTLHCRKRSFGIVALVTLVVLFVIFFSLFFSAVRIDCTVRVFRWKFTLKDDFGRMLA